LIPFIIASTKSERLVVWIHRRRSAADVGNCNVCGQRYTLESHAHRIRSINDMASVCYMVSEWTTKSKKSSPPEPNFIVDDITDTV